MASPIDEWRARRNRHGIVVFHRILFIWHRLHSVVHERSYPNKYGRVQNKVSIKLGLKAQKLCEKFQRTSPVNTQHSTYSLTVLHTFRHKYFENEASRLSTIENLEWNRILNYLLVQIYVSPLPAAIRRGHVLLPVGLC